MEKHKTFGVSFHPGQRDRANNRAKNLGLSFSRYVTLCVEAELNGQIPSLLGPGSSPPEKTPGPGIGIDIDEAIERGGQYSEAKTLSIDFEDDIEEILTNEELCYTRAEKIAHLRTDFVLQHIYIHTGTGAGADPGPETERTLKIALECRYNIKNRYEVTLGQLIILQNLPALDAVILIVPYLQNFDPIIKQTYQQQNIQITTPDNLLQTLNQTIQQLEEKK